MYVYVSFRRPSGIDKEFLVQLFVEPVKGISVVHTQDLLTNMFLDQSISFVKVSIKVSSVYVLISFLAPIKITATNASIW